MYDLRSTIYDFKFLLILVFISLLSSCKLFNPDEKIPSYIRIEKINYKTNITEDTDSQDITDAWVYIDDQPIGAFELPAKFPVLITGAGHRVEVKAGIKLFGISATRAFYPFYQPYDTIVDLPEGKVVSLNPRTTYVSGLKQGQLFENFEGVTNLHLKKTARSSSNIKAVRYDSLPSEDFFKFGKNYAGLVTMTTSSNFFELISDTSYTLPVGATPVFLEMDYKTNNTFTITVGLASNGTTNLQEVVTINPTDTWKKIYVNLTPFVNADPNATDYKLYFNQWLNDGISEAIILMDNIKVITK